MVTFYNTLGDPSDVTEIFQAGTASSPQVIRVTRAGTYAFCGGEWYASLDLQVPTTLVGIGGASQNTLSGADEVRVLETYSALEVVGVTLTSGKAPRSGSGPQGFGGALYCGLGGSLRLEDVTISGSEAVYGGGLYLYFCPSEIYSSAISGNRAGIHGGGLGMQETTAYLEDTHLSGNRAASYGGGVYITTLSSSTAASLDLVDTLVESNTAGYFGSAMYVYPGYGAAEITLSCTRSETGTQGGFLNNSDDYTYGSVGALYLLGYYGLITFTSSQCDFGIEGAADDNASADIAFFASIPPGLYSYDNAASFTCTNSTGCR